MTTIPKPIYMGGTFFLPSPGTRTKILTQKNLKRIQKLLVCATFEEIMHIDLDK